MKGKAVIPLVLGLGIGLVAVKYVIDTVKQARASGASSRTVKVVRAKQDIGAYVQITPEMVELVETGDGAFAPSSDRITKIEDLKDRVAGKSIPRFSPVLQSMLAPPGTPHGMQGRIKQGYRAVSVKIDEVTGVAYQVQPGDLVDVIVVMDIDSGDRGKKKETIAEVILQRVEVAAIGQSTSGASEEAGSKVKPAKSATLLVTEADVPKLHLAATRGKITLSMRGTEDETFSPPAVAHSNDLFKTLQSKLQALSATPALAMAAPKPVPMSQPAPRELDAPHGVIVYRRATIGNTNVPVSVERITFESAQSSKIIDVSDSPFRRTSSMMRTSLQGSRPDSPAGVPPTGQEDLDNQVAPGVPN